MDPGSRTWRGGASGLRSSHTIPHFVKMYGRSFEGMPSSACRTTSSECPKPYTAAVSIQFTPRSTAWRMLAMDWASSWGPQPNAQPPPPTAQAPNPTGVNRSSVLPSRRVGKVAIISPTPHSGRSFTHKPSRHAGSYTHGIGDAECRITKRLRPHAGAVLGHHDGGRRDHRIRNFPQP